KLPRSHNRNAEHQHRSVQLLCASRLRIGGAESLRLSRSAGRDPADLATEAVGRAPFNTNKRGTWAHPTLRGRPLAALTSTSLAYALGDGIGSPSSIIPSMWRSIASLMS